MRSIVVRRAERALILPRRRRGASLGVASTAPAVTRRRELAHSKFYFLHSTSTNSNLYRAAWQFPDLLEDGSHFDFETAAYTNA